MKQASYCFPGLLHIYRFCPCFCKHICVSVCLSDDVYELPTLKVCSSVDETKEEAYFSCFAKDFSPNTYEIKWLKDEQVITGTIDEVITSSQGRNDTNGTTLFSVASLLTLPSREVPEGSKLTCLFKGKGERNPVYLNSTVSHKQCSVGEYNGSFFSLYLITKLILPICLIFL